MNLKLLHYPKNKLFFTEKAGKLPALINVIF
jgi:hypothetical protein